MRFGIELGEQMDSVVPQRIGACTGQPLSEQQLHRLALIQEDPHITTCFAQAERFFEDRR
jgi:hypothetical protein